MPTDNTKDQDVVSLQERITQLEFEVSRRDVIDLHNANPTRTNGLKTRIKYLLIPLLFLSGCGSAQKAQKHERFNVEDRLEIINVLNSYSHYFDHGQTEDWLNLFTEDCVFEIAGGPEFKGRAGLTPLVVRAKKWLETGVQRRHRLGNIVFHEQTNSNARISVYLLLASTANKEDLSFVSTGEYDGWLVKDEGEWKISKWVISTDRSIEL
jgi:3-phenylpropionate/cinnamic acid dioxygenase small subunit